MYIILITESGVLMSTGITSHADSIMSALKMSNKNVKHLLKSFDDNNENFLGFILKVSNDFDSFEILTFDDDYYLKRGVKSFWITSGNDFDLVSFKMVSYSSNVGDKKLVVKNLGFNTEPTKLDISSITIDGETYRII